MDGHVLMGVVGRPHGVRGDLHLQCYAADPADLSRYGALIDDQGRRWSVRWRRPGIAELRDAAGHGVADRDAAAKLTNLRLYVARDRLPEPAADEFYLADLLGLAVFDRAGQPVGAVVHLHDYGAGASLEIARTAGGTLLIPFTRACVPEVDVGQRRVVIDPPDEIEATP